MLEATLAILNANVITLDTKHPKAEAIAINDRKIIAVGSNIQIRGHINKKTKVIHADRKTVIPGLVDCHVHMTGFGLSLEELDLRATTSIKQLQQKLRTHAKNHPEKGWILGGRWDQERFTEKRYPKRTDLDSAVSDRPVFLLRVCGHVAIANSKALQLAGVNEKTAVSFGKVDLDEKTGKPTGILRENALGLIRRAIPPLTAEEIEQACFAACQTAVQAGLTCIHWILGSMQELRALQRLNLKGKLPIRVYLGVPAEYLDELKTLGITTGFGNDMLKMGFVKILADGSLGGRTAALKEPYSDKPETRGMMLYRQKELDELILKAYEAGLQLAVHAIGDRAMDSALKAYDKALSQHPRRNHRNRVEHCSVLNPSLIKRMKQLNLVASVQPHFVISDFWATDRVGKKRARWVYPFKTLLNEGVTVASGSDCPVEPIKPVLGIWAAVARENSPEERLSVDEALRTYTLNAAYASFDEEIRGTIELGKLADLTILSDDPNELEPGELRKMDVEMTVVDGRIVYASEHFQNELQRL